MANNPYVNKVEYAGQMLMDLTEDTVTPSDVLNGVTFHDRSGAPQTGNLITKNIAIMSQKINVTTTAGGGVSISNFTNYDSSTDTPIFAISPDNDANIFCVFTATSSGKPGWVQIRKGNGYVGSTYLSVELFWIRII